MDCLENKEKMVPGTFLNMAFCQLAEGDYFSHEIGAILIT
jgi:hypothetical protein